MTINPTITILWILLLVLLLSVTISALPAWVAICSLPVTISLVLARGQDQ